MRRIIAAAVACSICSTQVFAACTLPVDVSTRVGRGQSFTSYVPDISVFAGGVRDIMWGHSRAGANIDIPVGVYGSRYMTSMRSPYQFYDNKNRGIDWFKEHHPDWIVYRPDHKTPAWMFCDPEYGLTADSCSDDRGFATPLAIWKTEVRDYLKGTEDESLWLEGPAGSGINVPGSDVYKVVENGTYKMMGVDNADPVNKWAKAGTCNINPGELRCEDAFDSTGHHGVWTSRYQEGYAIVSADAAIGTAILKVYSGGTDFKKGMLFSIRDRSDGLTKKRGNKMPLDGTETELRVPVLTVDVKAGDILEAVTLVDTQHATDLREWLDNLHTYLNSVNLCMQANMIWTSDSRELWVSQASKMDVVTEEVGFTGTDKYFDVPKSEKLSMPNPVFGELPLNNTWVWYDQDWLDKITDWIATGKPTFFNAANTLNYASRERRIIYGLASYLLMKNARSYQSMSSNGHSVRLEEYWPDTYWTHGAASGAMTKTNGVYNRTFENGLVLLNSSSTATLTYNLGSSVYYTQNGLRWTGVVTLSPVTAMILHSGAPPVGSIVLAR